MEQITLNIPEKLIYQLEELTIDKEEFIIKAIKEKIENTIHQNLQDSCHIANNSTNSDFNSQLNEEWEDL